MREIQILGAGPAGSSAAITALQCGAPVRLIEKATFPRHKVCGEFLSPEATGILDALGVWQEFHALGPATIRRMNLVIGTCRKTGPLPDPAWGCSRFALDYLLYQKAKSLGAEVVPLQPEGTPVDVLATGRSGIAKKGQRLFGFKAHFQGPVDDAVELYFFNGCYIGVCAVEGGITNVCGLGPESVLQRCHFEYDELVSQHPPLAERLKPLARTMKWLSTGPLIFGNVFRRWKDSQLYPAGDALSFVDPFTGSGIVSAMLGGRLAGNAAARRIPARDHIANCSRALSAPFRVASCLRAVLRLGLGEKLAPLIPSSWLFLLTRPHA